MFDHTSFQARRAVRFAAEAEEIKWANHGLKIGPCLAIERWSRAHKNQTPLVSEFARSQFERWLWFWESAVLAPRPMRYPSPVWD